MLKILNRIMPLLNRMMPTSRIPVIYNNYVTLVSKGLQDSDVHDPGYVSATITLSATTANHADILKNRKAANIHSIQDEDEDSLMLSTRYFV